MSRFNISLPRCSYEQATIGKKVNKNRAKPGDLLFFLHGSRVGHVALYVGNNRMYEAKGAKYGIVASNVNWNKVYCVRNVLD